MQIIHYIINKPDEQSAQKVIVTTFADKVTVSKEIECSPMRDWSSERKEEDEQWELVYTKLLESKGRPSGGDGIGMLTMQFEFAGQSQVAQQVPRPPLRYTSGREDGRFLNLAQYTIAVELQCSIHHSDEHFGLLRSLKHVVLGVAMLRQGWPACEAGENDRIA